MSTILVPRKEARAATSEVCTRSGLPREGLAWHPSVPRDVAQADGWHDGTPGWVAWIEHLAGRRQPAPLACWSGKRSPLVWALLADLAAADTSELIAGLHKPFRASQRDLVSTQLHAWLADRRGAPADPALGLESLAWSHALPRLGSLVPAEAWWELLARLLETVSDARAAGTRNSSGMSISDAGTPPWPRQLLAVELPLTLAWCLPELETCRSLADHARQELDGAIVQLIDDVGLPRATDLEVLGPLVACWTRCRSIGQYLEEDHWSEASRQRFSLAVRSAWRLAQHDGRLAGTAGRGPDQHKSTVEMLTAAAELTGDDTLRSLAAQVLGPKPSRRGKELSRRGKKPSRRGKKSSRRGKKPSASSSRRAKPARGAGTQPHAGIGSDHSQVSILRCDWRRGSPQLVVQHDLPGAQPTTDLPIELSSGRELLLGGTVEIDLHLAKQKLVATGIWESICWESDEAMDYLELELQLNHGVKVQRQLLLARASRLLLMADAVTIAGATPSNGQSAEPPLWEHRLRLPMADGVCFEASDETREGWLRGDRRAAAVFPLALGEWRADGRPGSLAASGGVADSLRDSPSRLEATPTRVAIGQQLELHSLARGRGFYAPLLFDLDPRRVGQSLTWRRLTVAENRHIQPPDAAAGFRVQIGREQWVLYRSLTGPANRTLLGMNTYSEFLLGRFERDGECQPILEVEPADDEDR